MTPTREELATTSEIAHMLQVSIKVVVNWVDRRNRNNFPAPVAKLAKKSRGKGFLWLKADVIAWHRSYDSSYWRTKTPVNKDEFVMLEVDSDKTVRSHSHAQW